MKKEYANERDYFISFQSEYPARRCAERFSEETEFTVFGDKETICISPSIS